MGRKKKSQNRNKNQNNQHNEDKKSRREKRKDRNREMSGKWKNQSAELIKQLSLYNLNIKEMKGDGNCLFRAFADQIEGNQNLCAKYRDEIVKFMINNRNLFEPFVEEDEKFDDYISDMKKDGIWGGNMEIQAASLLYKINIIIHILNQPPYIIMNHDINAKCCHISYHLGEHYNSVRFDGDMNNTIPIPLPLFLDNVPNKNKKEDELELSNNNSPNKNDVNNKNSTNRCPWEVQDEMIEEYAMNIFGINERSLIKEAFKIQYNKKAPSFDMIDNDYEALLEIISILHQQNLQKNENEEEKGNNKIIEEDIKEKVEHLQNKNTENSYSLKSNINLKIDNEEKKEKSNNEEDIKSIKFNEKTCSSLKNNENNSKEELHNISEAEKKLNEAQESIQAKNPKEEEKKLENKPAFLGKNKKCHCGSKKTI